MRKPRLFRWTDPARLAGLLVVAQRIEEALFDYSVDTYKIPALNTRSRCLELSKSIEQVRAGRLSDKSLQSIVEEIVWSIDVDPAARALLGAMGAELKPEGWWALGDLRKLQIQVSMLRGRLDGGAYERELVTQIRTRLDDGKRRQELLNLTTSLVVEWLNRGFSRGFIFMKTRAFFFSPTSVIIENMSSFDAFVEIFNREERSYKVILRMNAASSVLAGLLPEKVITVSAVAPPAETDSRKEKAFLTGPHDGIFVSFNDIKALDPRSAYDQALRTIDISSRLVSFHAHRDRLMPNGDALVYEEGFVTRLKQSPLAVHKEGDRAPNDVPEACLRTIGKFFRSRQAKESSSRIMAALGLHASAVSVHDTSVQLTSLWSALEALLPIAADQVKITLVIEYLAPILCRRYPLRLITQLESDLKACCPDVYASVSDRLTADVPTHLKCAAIVAIEENEPLRTELYAALDQSPLLKNRIYQIKKATDSANSISELLENHRIKVTWHIRRIYRSRNLATHAGQALPYISSLVENLHSYFHRAVEAIEECVAAPHHAPNIDAALLACQMEDKVHQTYLRSNKKSATSADNLSHFLGGPIFAETAPSDRLEQYAHDQIPDS